MLQNKKIKRWIKRFKKRAKKLTEKLGYKEKPDRNIVLSEKSKLLLLEME
jgi:hypothetical protein